jgi:hypothetical protein
MTMTAISPEASQARLAPPLIPVRAGPIPGAGEHRNRLARTTTTACHGLETLIRGGPTVLTATGCPTLGMITIVQSKN